MSMVTRIVEDKMTYYIQIDDEVREATASEIEAIKEHQASVAQLELQEQQRKQNRELAVNKLAALGLTPSDLAALDL
jgi:hypothetical protein